MKNINISLKHILLAVDVIIMASLLITVLTSYIMYNTAIQALILYLMVRFLMEKQEKGGLFK